MDDGIADELLSELFSAFETIDTQSAAILLFLKDKGIVTDAQLAPYLEQAGNASNVRWRAVRVRIDSLLSSAAKKAEEALVRKAEEAAQKAIAAEREAERSTRRRRKTAAEKPLKDANQAEEPNHGKQPGAVNSTAEGQSTAQHSGDRQKPAEGRPENDKPEAVKSDEPESEPGQPRQKIA
jgi:hypothetical protein